MALKILIIDDDNEICELVRLFLELEGHTVATANTGMSGLEFFRSKPPDLIVLDIGLPDANGQQICRLIRSESDVPIIMLSARDSVSDKVISLDYGADDYITKPFENIELLARINAVKRRAEKLHATPAPKDGKIDFYHLTIDTIGKKVLRNGESVLLTPKEYDLFIYFIGNTGIVLSRDKIVGDLWGNDTLYRWSRNLDVHVRNLRQKIEINPKNPEIIKTVPGMGYKVKE